MNFRTSHDVLVVGTGPAGLAAAHALARIGLRVAAIGMAPQGRDTRTAALFAGSVTLLENLVKLWRAKTARKEMTHRLLIVIDEAANVAPMPALRRHVGEGRGLGVNP